MNITKETTIEELNALPLMKIDYVGETVRDNDWKCDQWRVGFTYDNAKGKGFFSVDYYTGTGLRKEVKRVGPSLNGPYKIVGGKWVPAVPVKPTNADVLYALVNDADAADYNFNEWCENFGYSDDSIKALNIYKECLETATRLRKVFTYEQLQALREILTDY